MLRSAYMKKQILALLMMSTVLSTAFGDIDSVTFVDVTGKKFLGADKDLELVSINGMRTRCSDEHAEAPQSKILSWKTVLAERPDRVVRSYTIAFAVTDRHGGRMFSGEYIWEKHVASAARHVSSEICWDRRRSVPGNDAVILPISSIKYSTVTFWIKKIETGNPVADKKLDADLTLQNDKALKSTSLQSGSCSLEKNIRCADYSQQVEFQGLRMGARTEVESNLKQKGLNVEIIRGPLDVRYFVYRNGKARSDRAVMLSIYSTTDGVIRHFNWTDGSYGLPVHIEGMRRYLSKVHTVDLNEDGYVRKIGPNATYLTERDVWGVQIKAAGVGPRPQEVRAPSQIPQKQSGKSAFMFRTSSSGTLTKSRDYDTLDDCIKGREELFLEAVDRGASEAPQQSDCN